MGIYAKAEITVNFETVPPIKLMKLQTLLQEYVGKDNYINCYDIEMYEETLSFCLDSSRSVNLEWQVEQTLEYFKSIPNKIIEFSSNAFIQLENACVYLDEGDLEEF